MRKPLIAAVLICAIMALAATTTVLANSAVKGNEPGMMVSPQTIVLAKTNAVTVHTNIPATSVAAETVTLDDVAPLAVWADDCGDLAARFDVDALTLIPARQVLLTLRGVYTSGDTFAAEDTVRVK